MHTFEDERMIGHFNYPVRGVRARGMHSISGTGGEGAKKQFDSCIHQTLTIGAVMVVGLIPSVVVEDCLQPLPT